jgi:hypothetical protein
MTEQQLRKALGAVNDLEPPRDDLFAQRALGRGRARAHRRRSAVLGAAAGVAAVGAIGGSWLSGAWTGGSPTTASAPERVAVSQGGAGHAPDLGAPPQAPTLQSQLDTRSWFSGPATPASTAMETLAPTLAAQFPDVFAGAYAADAGNTRIVVSTTRADAELERAVSDGLPSGTDVAYRTVAHSIRELDDTASRLEAARADLQSQGVTVLGIQVEPRTNRVLVTTQGPDHGAVQSLVGADLVWVLANKPQAPTTRLPSSPVAPTTQH